MSRTVDQVECDLLRAVFRRKMHPDPISRRTINRSIDILLDERNLVAPIRARVKPRVRPR